MWKWIVAAVGVLVLSIGISATHLYLSRAPPPPPSDPARSERNRQIALQYEQVSLLRLLATPERYDGRKVQVAGFVTLEFEGTGLHLDREAYEAGLRKNSVWLDRPDWLNSEATSRLDRRYAEVAGTFEASHLGQYGLYSGALTKLQRIAPTFTSADYERWRAREAREALARQLLSVWFLTLVGWTALATLWALRRRRTQRHAS